jgi:hypothetical protein
MSLAPVSQSLGSYGLFESNSANGFITNSKIAPTDDNSQIVDDDAKIPVKVSLKGKPAGMSAGEYLLRQALEKIAPHVGLDSSDLEAEIQARKGLTN